MAKKNKIPLSVETLKHDDATRKNIPTADYPSVMAKNEQSPVRVAYWFVDTDYEEAWESPNSDTSRPFNKPKSGRITEKVINHLGMR